MGERGQGRDRISDLLENRRVTTGVPEGPVMIFFFFKVKSTHVIVNSEIMRQQVGARVLGMVLAKSDQRVEKDLTILSG